MTLGPDELELIERLVHHDRTAVSSALLAIAGIGAGEAMRGAVLAQLSEAASSAEADGAISAERGGQIARHVSPARWELCEPVLEDGEQIGREAKFDRARSREGAVGETAGDTDRLHPTVPHPTKASHRELLLAPELMLDPRRRPSTGQVARVTPFGNDAFEAELADARDERLGVVRRDARRCPPCRAVERQFLEQRPTLPIWESEHRAPVKVQDVEDLEHHRVPAIGGGSRESAAQPVKVGAPVRPQTDQLAVERHPPGAKDAGDLRQLGKLRRALAAVAGAQRNRAAVMAELRAAAVPLQLEHPSVAVGHRSRAEQHRRNEPRLFLVSAHREGA